MTDVVRSACGFARSSLCVLVLAVGMLIVSAAPAAEKEAAVRKFDPDDYPAPVWISLAKESPVHSNLDAEAKKEPGMKPYKEAIPGTDVTFEMVPISGGRLVMGSPEGEKGRNDDEGPQVEVELEPFWMGKHEVTWDEFDMWRVKLDIQLRRMEREREGKTITNWEKLVDAMARPTAAYGDPTFGMGHDGYPAVCMTQYAAEMYCRWLTANTGRYYRLPTEAEWEYACRAGTTTAYWFGDDPKDLDEHDWYYDNADDKYQKVGKKKPNPWGLYDMHGNVAEWVLDQYIPDFYKKQAGKTAKNPFAVPTTEYPRAVRGGSWDDDPKDCRSAVRRGSSPDWKMQDPQIPQSIWYMTDATYVGFRVVRPLQEPTPEEAKLYEPDPTILKEYIRAQGGKE